MGAKLPWVEVGVRFPERIAGPCPQKSILTLLPPASKELWVTMEQCIALVGYPWQT